ncbi:MAG: FkbM family methyltransferase [Pseudomonadota bacterium]
MIRRLKWRIGRRLYCDARGEQASPAMVQNGEAFLQRSVVANVPTDTMMVAFDIGANQADWTRRLLAGTPDTRRHPNHLRIHAFEPVLATASMFTEALRQEPGQDCVKLNAFGLSDHPGRIDIGIFAEGAGTNSLHFERDTCRPKRAEPVLLNTLDQYCAEQTIDHIHLVKCDAEGHDAHIIEGAANTLKAGRIDIFQFEYNHRWVLARRFLRDVFDIIDGTDYTLGRLDPQHVSLFDSWHFELERFFWSNYVLVHKRALNWFPTAHGRFDASNVYG